MRARIFVTVSLAWLLAAGRLYGGDEQKENHRKPKDDADLKYWLQNMVWQCAVSRRRFSVGAIPTWQLLLQPVAIGAVVEVTKLPKPSMESTARRCREQGRP